MAADGRTATRLGLLLTPGQARIAAAGVTVVAAALVAAFAAGLVLLAFRALLLVRHVVGPVLAAMVLAILFKPWYLRLVRWTRARSPVVPMILFLLSVAIPLLAVCGLFGGLLAGQLLRLLDALPEAAVRIAAALERALPELQHLLARAGIDRPLCELLDPARLLSGAWLRGLGGATLSTGAAVLGWVPVVACWLVTPVYLLFFLLRPPVTGAALADNLPFLSERGVREVAGAIDEFLAILAAFFRGQIIVAAIQGVLLAVGFWLVGLEYGFALGFVLGLLNVVPYLGNMLGLSVTLPLALFGAGGCPLRLGLVLGVFFVVQTLDGYLITPKVMGRTTNLHPGAIIFGIFFWGTVFGGFLGLLLAIPLTAFFKVLWPRLLARSRTWAW